MKNVKLIFKDKIEGMPAIEGEETFYVLLSQKQATDVLGQWFNKVKSGQASNYDLFEDEAGVEECVNELKETHSPYVLLTGNVGMNSVHVDCHIWAVDEDSLSTLASYEDNDPETQSKLEKFAKSYQDYLANTETNSTNSKKSLEKMILKKELEDIQNEINAELSIEASVPEKDLVEIEQTTDSLILQVVKVLDEHDYDYRDYFINKGLMTLNMLSDFILSKEMNEVRFRQFVKSVNVADESYQWHFVDKRTGQIKDLARTSTGSLISTRLYTIKEIVEDILNVIK